jgi:hypothetical protein
MAEAQAVDRVHRIGQQQDVTIIRYNVSESIESVSVSIATCEAITSEEKSNRWVSTYNGSKWRN